MITFYSYNLADFANITASNENALFPTSNLKDDRRSKVFRSTGSTSNIIFDMLTQSSIDTFIVIPDPIRGYGFDALTIEASATADFSVPAFTQAITIDDEFGIGINEFAAQSYRFWRIVATGADHIELSKVFFGSKISMTTNSIDYNWSYEEDDNSIISKNRYGQRFIDKIPSQTKTGFQLRFLNTTEVDQIFEIYDYNRTTKPFFIKIGDGSNTMISNENRFAGYFYLERMPRVTNPAFGLYNMSMRLEEGM